MYLITIEIKIGMMLHGMNRMTELVDSIAKRNTYFSTWNGETWGITAMEITVLWCTWLS